VSSLTDRSVSLGSVFGPAGRRLEKELLGDDLADEVLMDMTDQFLLARMPPLNERLALVTRMVETVVATTELTRVEDLAEQFGMTERSTRPTSSRTSRPW
jgi:hypothetical protein